MFVILDELKYCIYKTNEYLSFIEVKNKLEDDEIHHLLLKYHDINAQYYEIKKYEKYTDISSVKDEYRKMRKEVSENKVIQDYYNKYNELNDMLDEMTNIIFDGISKDLNMDRYLL